MIAATIVYALLVGALIGVAALGMDGLCRLARWPARWVWLAALLLAVATPALAPRAPAPESALLPTAAVSATTIEAAPRERSVTAALLSARAVVNDAIERAIAAAGRALPPASQRLMGLAWLALALGIAVLQAMAYLRIRRARRGWPAIELHGARVRLAPHSGPAVVGIARPDIVVPRWLLDRTPEEQRLVVAHEREHLRARDPLLLAAGCAAVALVPWNPAAWWMLARLQLAVETDCDARVLRGGAQPRPYGTLLIDLAGRSAGLPLGAPALAGRRSTLERRLLAMTSRPSRRPLLRGGALAALALAASLAACEARLPTAAEVEQADVAAVEKYIPSVKVEAGTTQEYFVDGQRTTAEQARNLAPTMIASVQVEKGLMRADGTPAPARVMIETKAHEQEAAGAIGGRVPLRAKVADSSSLSVMVDGEQPMRVRANGTVPLFYIDGVKVEAGAVQRLAPDAIESVEVIKSEAAVKLHGEAARQGIVRVTTRKSPR